MDPVPSLIALAIAASTGGLAAAPEPTAEPAATTIAYVEKYGWFWRASRMAKHAATSFMNHTECAIDLTNSGYW